MSNCAVSDADGTFVRGMKCTALENRSIIVRMLLWWLDGGNPVTKSRAMWDQGAVWCVTLAWAQTEQAETKLMMSSLIPGHQKLRWMNNVVLLAPGWPESREE